LWEQWVYPRAREMQNEVRPHVQRGVLRNGNPGGDPKRRPDVVPGPDTVASVEVPPCETDAANFMAV
jgi:hypothetical protein